MRLRFTRKAERQLAAILDFIAKDNPGAAVRVVRDIQATARLLTEFPEMGRPGAVPTTRECVVSGLPYIMIYRAHLVTKELNVIQIVHGARNRKRM